MIDKLALTLALCLCFLVADPAARPLALLLERVLGRFLRVRLTDIAGLARFISVTASMMAVALAFGISLADDFLHFFKRLPDPVLGIGLGLACFGISQIPASMLRIMPVFRQDLAAGREKMNRDAMSAGWLKYYRDVYNSGKTNLVILVFLYVATEEIIFRLVMTLIWGQTLSCLVISTVLFSLAQIPGYTRKDLRYALYPIAGAVVMGPVHLQFFWATHSILLVTLSHFVFFIVGFMIQLRMEKSGRPMTRAA
jgi:hypothetical protein